MNVDVAKIVGKHWLSPHRYPPGSDGDAIARRCAACGQWCQDDTPEDCPANWHPQSAAYTVDDLLAWLVEQGFQVTTHHGETPKVAVSLRRDGAFTGATGPTLLGALELAVLAVNPPTDITPAPTTSP